jgi:hypothetical protein
MRKMMLLIMVLAAMLSAAIVPVDRAKKVAENYYQFYAPSEAKGNVIEKVLTKEYLGQPTWYVVKFTKGWVIVAAEDNVRPILGYSFESGITEDIYNMRNPFVKKFSYYDKQIVHDVREKGIVRLSQQNEWKNAEKSAFPPASKAAVGPLVQTKWHQDYPFNNLCPTGTPVGCVATAMTQIMRYYQGPATWAGSASYNDISGSTTGSHSVTSGTYTWSLMQGIYASDFDTTEERAEIAELSYHAGVSVNMDYETDGSGAQLSDAVQALKDHFSFDNSGVWATWGTIADSSANYATIKANIDANHPMELAGYGVDGGHAYVLSGYNVTVGSSYLYHFNWGWGGSYDGWFKLNDLSPGTSDFTESQQAGYNLFVNGLLAQMPPPATCTGSVSGSGDVTVNWTVPTPVTPMGTLVDYYIYRNRVLVKVMGGIGTRTWVDPARPQGTSEYYVKGFYNDAVGDPMGLSNPSPSYNATVVSNPTYPEPKGLLVVGMDSPANQMVRSHVDLSWNKPFVGTVYVYDGFEGNVGNEYIAVPTGWVGRHNTGTTWPPTTWVATTGTAGWIALGTSYNAQYSLVGDWSAACLGSGNNYSMMFFNTVKNLTGVSGTFIEWYAFTLGDNGNLKALLYAGTSVPTTLVAANLKTIGSETYQADDQYTHVTKITVPTSYTGNHFVGICYDAVNTDAYVTIDEFRCGYDSWPAGTQPTSYQIYRNGTLATTVSATGLSETYEDTGYIDGTNTYYVRAVYPSSNYSIACDAKSAWMEMAPAPYFLAGSWVGGTDDADLTWYAPSHYPAHWFAWEYETDMWNYLTINGAGLTGNVTMARTYFNAMDFGMNYPVYISDISAAFYLDTDAGETWDSPLFKYAIGYGPQDTPTYLHTSANQTALGDGTFIDYALPSTYTLNEDWFVEIQYVDLNSCDPNIMTNVHEEGNGIGWNSSWYYTGDGSNDAGWYAFTYNSPYEYEDFMIYCYGWNDEGTYTKIGRTPTQGKEIANKKLPNITDNFASYIPQSKQGAQILKDSDTKAFSQYKIYRAGSSVGTSTSEAYTDANPIIGDNTYYVTAVWTAPAAESAASNTIEVGPPVNISLTDTVRYTAAPGSNTTNAFNISNTDRGWLDYTLTFNYTTPLSQWVAPINENCTSLTDAPVWVASGSGGTAWTPYTTSTLDGTSCFRSVGTTTNSATSRIITSPTFDGTDVDSLEFDQYFLKNGATAASGTVDISTNGGGAWTNIYTVNTTTGGYTPNKNHQKIAITSVSTTMQVRFTLTCASRNNSAWAIDNITLGGLHVNFDPWFSFVSPQVGEVQGITSNAISCGYNATTLAVGTYYVNVTVASDDPDTPSIVLPVKFKVANLPAVPTLVAPTDASTTTDTTPTFDWADVSGATSYTIQVDNNSDFSSVEQTSSPAVSEYTATTLGSGTYYWRVLATNANGSSAYSGSWSVIVQATVIPGVPTVTTSVVAGQVKLAWAACADATSYDVYSSATPYGTFTLLTNVAVLEYTYTGTETKMFFYVVSKNSTKASPRTIEIAKPATAR